MFFVWFLAIALIIVAVHLYVKRQYSFWADKGIPFERPRFPFGNVKLIGRDENISVQMARIYNEHSSDEVPFVGLYFFVWPVVLATSLNFIKSVCVTDFQHFQERGRYYNERDDPISANLFNLVHKKWKIFRSKLTPAFTRSKLKSMYPILLNTVNNAVTEMANMLDAQDEINIFDFVSRIQIDIIGACTFGIEPNCLKNPDSEFVYYSEKVVTPKFCEEISSAAAMKFRCLANLLHIRTIRKDVSEFFTRLIRDTVEYREKNNVQKDDLIGQMMALKNAGYKNDKNGELIYMSLNEIVAQTFALYMGGIETASTTLAFVLYELAQPKNRHMQVKAQSEINATLQKYNGQLTFEALHEMPYVDAIVNETLRKYPPVPYTSRLTTKEYTCSESKITIPKNMTIIIPIYGVHHDPQIYKNPDEFRPERFVCNELNERPSIAFLPFGAGPRNCIAFRMGIMQIRCSFIMLLKNFTFSTCDKTIPMPIKYHPWKLTLVSQHDIILNVRKN